MKSKFFTTVAAMFFAVSVFAQDGAFKVLSAKGDNVVQKNGEYVALGPGTQLPPNAKVMIAEGASVVVSNSNNQTFTLDKAGIYTMNDVAGNFKSDNSSIAQRYMAFVFNEMKAGDETKTSNLSITGSVERSLSNSGINLFSPESTYFMSKKTTVKWEPKSDASGEYRVELLNLFDEPVVSKEVSGNSTTIDLGSVAYEDDAIYKLVVYNKSNPSLKSGELIMRVPPQEELSQIEKDLKDLEAMNDQSAMYYALTAKVCIANGLFVDAVANYEKALEIEPNNAEVQAEYEKFLRKAGVKE